MTLQKIANGSQLTVEIEGRLDTSTAPEFESFVNDNIAGVAELIIDMKNLDYISSAGLRVLLSAQKKMNAVGKMIVKNANETVKEIFEVTGFCDILTIE